MTRHEKQPHIHLDEVTAYAATYGVSIGVAAALLAVQGLIAAGTISEADRANALQGVDTQEPAGTVSNDEGAQTAGWVSVSCASPNGCHGRFQDLSDGTRRWDTSEKYGGAMAGSDDPIEQNPAPIRTARSSARAPTRAASPPRPASTAAPARPTTPRPARSPTPSGPATPTPPRRPSSRPSRRCSRRSRTKAASPPRRASTAAPRSPEPTAPYGAVWRRKPPFLPERNLRSSA